MVEQLLRVCLVCGVAVLGLIPAPKAVAQVPDEAAQLWAQATLYRDAWGTPHVYAETPRALGFAFGYAQAQDHIEAMLMAFRTANGRAAEVDGEKMAASDEFALRLGHARLAEAAFATLDPAVADLCTGFAMGANTWLLEHEDSAPAWADGVRPSDPLALWHAFVCSMAPLDLPGEDRPPRAMDTGSAWALAPERSEDGRTMLVINPHGYFNGAFRWCEAHLVLGGMNVAGATLFGLPLIVQGHNGLLGWGLTPNVADFADVFTEEIQSAPSTPKNPFGNVENALAGQTAMLEYLAQSQPYYVRTQGGLEERAAPAMIGPRGPVFESGGTLYSWTIGGYGEFGAFSQLLEMANAQDLGGFQAALSRQQIPCFNVVYADREGNVLSLYGAKAGARNVAFEASQEPDSPQGIDWQNPVSSTLFDLAWGEGIGLEALPAILNPSSGYVQACGGPPWAFTDDAPIDPSLFPAWFIGDADTYRARRVRQLLRTGLRSFRDMQAMLYDTTVPAAMEMVPLLTEMADNAGERVHASHPDLATGMRVLKEWDFTADTTSLGMTYYHVWWNLLTAKHAGEFANAGALYAALAQKSTAAQDAALDAATDAARLMRNDLNSLEVPWGEAHRIVRGEKDYPMPGAGTGEPIFVASDFEYGAGKWRASYGYGVAMAIAFGEVPEVVSVATFGASENPLSPHYADQLELLLSQRFKRNHFVESDVLRNATEGYGRRVTLYPLGAGGEVLFESETPTACRLLVSADAHTALPEGLAAFTVFVRGTANPPTLLGDLAVSLGVPVDLCTDEDLDALALYQYTVGGGWQRVAEPTTENDGRILLGRVPQEASFAVLGPEKLLIKPSPVLPLEPLAKPDKQVDTAAQPKIEPEIPAPATPGDAAAVKAEKDARGTMSLRLKGGYVPEVAQPKQSVDESARGTRVIHLRGSELGDDAGLEITPDGKMSREGRRGKALWMEGLPPDLTFGPNGANTTPLPTTPTAEVDEQGARVLRLRGDGGGETPTETPQPELAAPQEVTADPPAEASGEKLSRKERKRLEREAANAPQVPQVVEFGPQGMQQNLSPTMPQGPGDSFGDVPKDAKEKKKKKR